ncbi:MAG: peroxiredoxin [Parachlamydiaceae bacterium]
MQELLKVGDTIPSFQIKDFEERLVTREDLLGLPFVLYFYPKDDTPGCTKEACEFRDVMDSFDDIEINVFGVSPDRPESHQRFAAKYELNFPLLSDEGKSLAQRCGVVDESGKIIRTTFICDSDGMVLWVEHPVNVSGHVQRVLEAINEVLS